MHRYFATLVKRLFSITDNESAGGRHSSLFRFVVCVGIISAFLVFHGCFKKSDESGSFLDKAAGLVNASGANAEAPTIITGRALDALTGFGLNKTLARTDGGLQAETRSDGLRDGVFVISGVPLGTYSVTLTHPKYEPMVRTIQVSEQLKGSTIDLGDISLFPIGSPVAGEVRGFVYSSAGGVGLDGALVTLENGITQSTLNSGLGPGGYFFPNAPVGTYTVTASLANYKPQTRQLTLGRLQTVRLDFIIAPESGTSGQTVEIYGNITGRIVDGSTLLGIDGVKVSTEGGKITYTYNNGVRAGIFGIERVPVGSYKLFAEHPGYLVGIFSVDVVAGTGFQNLSDLVVQKSTIPMASLRGIVYQAGTQLGINDATITLEGGAVTVSGNNGINDGAYIFDGTAPVGIYTATVRRSGFLTLSTGALTILPGVIQDRDFNMVRTQSQSSKGTVVGRIIDISRDIAAPPKARVRVVATPEPGSISGATTEVMTIYSPTRPDDDGSFTFLNVEPGIYTLTASLEGFQDASVSGIRVAQGDVTDGIRIEMSGVLGSISGFVYHDLDLDGVFTSSLDYPIPGATVEISGTGIRTKSRVNGSYLLDQVNLGTGYIVMAGASIEGRGRYLPSYVDGVSITSAAPAVTGVNVRLRPASTIAGKGHVDGYVRDKFGLPVQGATVEIDPGGANYRATRSESDGFFFIADINAGTYVVRAGKADYSSAAQVVDIPEDNTSVSLAAPFVLSPHLGSILGIVFNDHNGDFIYDQVIDSPVNGATVSVFYGAPPVQVLARSAMNGYFVLNDIPYGMRVIQASHDSYGKSSVEVSLFASTYFAANIAMKAEIGGVTGEVYLDLPGGTPGVRDLTDPFVQDAVVTLLNGTDLTFTTGSDGVFHFNDIPVGDQVLKVEKAGFAGDSIYVAIVPNSAVPAPPVSIGISPVSASLAGRIISRNSGEALGGVNVEVQGFAATATQSAPGSGSFLLGGLYPEAAGTVYYINAYSGTWEASQAGPYTLVPGQTLPSIDIGLVKRTGHIAGKVTDQVTSSALKGAVVSVIGTNRTATTDTSGKYEISRIDIGQVLLETKATGYLARRSGVLQVQANITTASNFILSRSMGGIQGRVTTMGSGTPLIGATVEILGAGSVLTDSQGVYSFLNIDAGTYSLIAYGLSHEAGVKSGVAVPGGAILTGTDFILTPSYGTVTGHCQDPFAYPSSLKDVLIRIDGTTLKTLTDSDGKYLIEKVPAGMRVVRASADGYPNVVSPSSVVPAGGTAIVDFTLVPAAGTVTGTVRDKFNTDPIVGAIASIPGLSMAGTTTSSGFFRIDNVPAGNDYSLNVTAAGYQTASLRNLDLPLDGNLAAGKIEMVRKTGSVSGRVMDSLNNLAIVSATVRMENYQGPDVMTDQNGSYTLTGVHILLDGATVSVSALGYQPVTTGGISIIDSIDTRTDFIMVPAYGAVAGEVVDSASNLGINGASVRIRGTFLEAITSSTGAFEFTRVPVSGGLTIEVKSLDFLDANLGPVAVILGQLTAVTIPMVPKFASVVGRVLDDTSGLPIADSTVNLVGMGLSFTTGIDGVFSIDRVLTTPSGVTVEAVRSGYSRGLTKTMALIPGQSTTADVRLTSLFGSIVGRVSDFQRGQGIFPAMVRIQGSSLMTTTASNGSYILTDVRTGNGITVEALASGFSLSRIGGVSVTPSATTILDFELKSTTGTLAGMIVDSITGLGITGVGISISGSVRSGYTDSNGQYEISLIPATSGTTVEIVGDGYFSQQIKGVVLQSGGTTTMNLSMTPTSGYLAGVVLNASDGRPIEGAVAVVTSTIESATTSSNGFFVFSRVTAGKTMTLEVQATNFDSIRQGGLIVGSGETVSLNFSLTPSSGSITGVVTSSVRGDVLPNVSVFLPDYSVVSSTNATGLFTVTGLNAATGVSLNLSYPGFTEVTRTGIVVEKGRTTSLEITMVPVHGLLAGLCVDAVTGLGLTGVVIVAIGSGYGTVTSGVGGYYQFEELPGNPAGYTIEASLDGYYNRSVNTGAIAPGSITGLDLDLTPNRGAITGTITSQVSGLGLEGVLLNVSSAGLTGVISSTGGYYILTNVPPSLTGYTIEGSLQGYANVSVASGPVPAGRTTSRNFMMTPSTGSISGTVTDSVTSIGITGALVSIPGLIMAPVNTESGGFYEITGIPPSSTGVTVEVSVAGYSNGSSLSSPIDAGGVVSLDFVLSKTTGSIAGSVVDWATGLPLVDVSLTVPGSGLPEFKSGAGGAYEITGVIASVTGVTVGASKTGYARADVHVAPILPGTSAYLNFVLTGTTGQITGAVTDSVSGIGLSGALLAIPGSGLAAVNSGQGGQYIISEVPVSLAGVTLDISMAGYFAQSRKTAAVEGGKATLLTVQLQPDSGILTGIVRNGVTGRPVDLAVVALTGGSPLRSTTDLAGYFEIEGVKVNPLGVTLEVSKSGYSGLLVRTPAITSGGIISQDIDLTATSGTVVGLVEDSISFQPVAGAVVTIPGLIVSATTSVGGSYVITNVPISPSGVTLEAYKNGYLTSSRGISSIAGGDSVTADFLLTPDYGAIYGIITDSIDSRALSGAEVRIPTLNLAYTTSSSGYYRLDNVDLSTTGFTIEIFKSNYDWTTVFSGPISPGSAVEKRIALTPIYGMVVGRVSDSVTLFGIQGARIYIEGSDAYVFTTSTGGNYTMTGIPASAAGYTLEARIVGYDTLKVKTGAIIAGNYAQVDFSLEPLSGVITGTVVDSLGGLGINGVVLTVPGLPFLRATSGVGGLYEMTGVPASVQGVTVMATMNGYKNGSEKSASVVGGKATSLDFVLEPIFGTIVGRISDSFSSLGLSGVVVYIPGVDIDDATTDTSGYYEISEVPSSTLGLTLEASRTGYRKGKRFLTSLFGGEVATLDILITPIYGTISGTVQDMENGLGISGVVISVLAGEVLPATTSSSGNYFLQNIPSGTAGITLEANHSRYSTKRLNSGIITAGSNTIVSFVMDPVYGTITGTVQDFVSGLGLTGASVRISALGINGSSGAGGYYELSNVPETSTGLTIEAVLDGYVSASAKLLSLTGGKVGSLDIGMTPLYGYLTGRVYDSVSSVSLEGARIIVPGLSEVTTITGGYFELFNVPVNPAGVTVQAFMNNYQVYKAKSLVVSPGFETVHDIPMIPLTGVILGVVSDYGTGQGVNSATVRLQGSTFTTSTDVYGSYVFSEVPAIALGYTVEASAAGYFNTIKSVGALAPGAFVTASLSLTPATGSLSGIVFDYVTDLPVSGAFVSVFGNSYGVTSDTGGNYFLTDVPVGSGATVEIQADRYIATSRFTGTVEGGRTSFLDVVMTPSFGSVTGQVTESVQGFPISDALVRLPALGLTAMTGSDGVYVISDVPINTFIGTVEAVMSDFGTVRSLAIAADKIVPPVMDRSLDMVMTKLWGSVVGTVVDGSSGTTLSNVMVTLSNNNIYMATFSDDSGRFRFTQVPTVTGLQLDASRGFQWLMDQNQTITLDVLRGVTHEVNVQMYANFASWVRVFGTIFIRDGLGVLRPAPNWKVSVFGPGNSTYTDNEGNFMVFADDGNLGSGVTLYKAWIYASTREGTVSEYSTGEFFFYTGTDECNINRWYQPNSWRGLVIHEADL